ncbi:MAG TPA: transcriptional regulator NrdR [Eubacterium sp.]|jgi:transcriptional repressor NrdR|nr:transcriptional regulator NrdR [Eubacterium sp.]HBZ52685.1 transcriptional regulator NrdR [Eubacterium sp.]
MKCPYCGSEDSKVLDSRPFEDSIKRRRECNTCFKRFNTFEKVESVPFMIIKKDGTRETYSREKLESGIVRSCHKRPVSAEEIKEILDDIENKIFSLDKREVSSTYIGENVMEALKNLDQVAYVRFASVYRDFKDANTFLEEMKILAESKDV